MTKPARQEATGRCPDCGAPVAYVRHVDSAYEFEWACARTPPHRGTVSWAHASPPPAFAGPVFEGPIPLPEDP